MKWRKSLQAEIPEGIYLSGEEILQPLMITPFSLQIETQVLEELQFIASFYLHPEVNVQVRVPIIMRYIGG